MKLTPSAVLTTALLVTFTAAASSHWNGGRNIPLHRLSTLDASKATVSATEHHARAFSLDKTCSQCHDTHLMKGASHFRTGLSTNEAPFGANKEPWFWINEKAGTAIPMSLIGQSGTFSPAAVGMTAWEWTKEFGRSFPGGGIGSDERAMSEAGGDRSRWFVTGPLEANCLACHQQDGNYDSSEWARQILRENFSGAVIAASGLGDVDGMNARMASSWDGFSPENPDDHLFKIPQTIEYDKSKFDSKDRCIFRVGKPKNDNCLACHSVSQKGMPSHAIKGDVHIRAGLKCIDCHQNGMDHRVATKSCSKCHMKDNGEGPLAKHTGIPLVHFTKLSCNVCHTGVTKDGELAQVRTSRANRIGIYGRAQWASDTPNIIEPVFVKDENGKIRACRMTWPSYFAKLDKDGKVTPIRPDDASLTAAVQKYANDALTKSSIAAIISSLKNADKNNQFVFIGHGSLWKVEGTNIVASANAAADPIAWPYAHDVRPARQARGAAAAKCASCHTADSKFFFGKIVPTGPVTDIEAPAIAAAELMGISNVYHKALGSTFAVRPLFKLFLWAVFALVVIIATAFSAIFISRLIKEAGKNYNNKWVKLIKLLALAGFVLSVLYLLASGSYGLFTGVMSKWCLMFHMVAGALLAVTVPVIAIIPEPGRLDCHCRNALWCIWIVIAGIVIFSAVMPMMTVFGSTGQLFLLWTHRIASFALIIVSLMLCAMSKRCLCKKKK
jgi:hypothetical protein